MADILYTYKNQVYANITNRCDCSCTFCIRSLKDSVGDSETLWHKTEPTLDAIRQALDDFDFTGYDELVFCGYGEPTCALDNLLASAAYAKEKYHISIRLNTNGLGNLPPQYMAQIITVLGRDEQVMINEFNRNLVAADNSLQLNIARNTSIETINGQNTSCSPGNQTLLVYYSATTRSIPPQTTPRRIIVLC